MLKTEIRKQFLKMREGLSLKRRTEASFQVKDAIIKTAQFPILSFASFKDEIDLWPLNEHLVKERRLLLPKMIKVGLDIYYVESTKQLIQNRFGILEPDPSLCAPFSSQEPFLILVPGVAFDLQKNRLGFGKGYYDRFLKTYPLAKKWGIGFHEQMTDNLPIEDHDQPMDQVLLF